jgi:predicted acylesterase/phospholipase RssA/CRP-like cAMP-binding protein
MAHAASLREVSALTGLSEELKERLAAEARVIHVAAGAWLLRKGEVAENLYIVRSGRLEVVDEGPPQRSIRCLRRGEVLGELALLKGGTRSASVRAQRDSELLQVGREQFEGLVQEAPNYALGLLRTVVAQLAVSRTPVSGTALPRAIAVVGLDGGAPAVEVADLLAVALGRHGSVARLAGQPADGKADLASVLDRAERDNDRVVLAGGQADPIDPWVGFCLREADLVIAVSSGAPAATWLDHRAALLGCELVITGAHVPAPVITALAPREVQVLDGAAPLRHGMEVTARRLAGRAIGVVLSGGGARAFAHIGVLEELRAAGVTIDRIGAVSLGAIVGAAAAMGFSQEAVQEAFERNFVETNPSNDYTLPAYSLIRGRKTRRLLDEAFGVTRIEELPTRFFCLSCDLVAREPFVHRAGPLSAAVYASLAIPGLFPPVATGDGRLLVDGGVLDNLPVATMAFSGEGPVIAVDVTGRMEQLRPRSRPRLDRVGRSLRGALTGSEAEIPRLGETVLRTLTVGSIDTVAAAREHADLVISPEVDGIGLMDWRRLRSARDAGRVAARNALAASPELFLS